MKLPSAWPFEVKKGSVTVKIYRCTNTKSGKTYDEFKVVYYDGTGKRRGKTFSDFQKARNHAEGAIASYRRGDAHALTLSNEDRLVYLRAIQSLRDVGVSLDLAAVEYAAAKRMLGQRSLPEAVEFFMRSCGSVQTRTVRDVVDELVDSRRNPVNKARPASAVYIKDLEGRLGKFADALQCNIGDIGEKEILLFLGSLKGTARTWFNYARLLKTLFKFAQSRRYYPKNVDPFENIAVEFEDDGEIEIFTPKELDRILSIARSELVPFIALGAFAGLRHAEICRLDWADIKSDHIEVKKSKAKTRSRRLVPIQPNLASWLAGYRQESGPVAPFANMAKVLLKSAAETGREGSSDSPALKAVEWKHNGLRHSFISYRLAITQNENQVAMEAGNSPQMIYAHYRQLVTADDAKAWFSIVPSMPANVLPVSIRSDGGSVQLAP